MAEENSVRSLMSSRVISVLPDTPIVTAIDILLSNNYSGVPVTDKSGVLVGILTKYDIIVKRASVRDDTKAGDLMNNDPLVLTDDMTVEDAIRAFAEHHKVDPIPVVDADRKVIGVISRFDMVRMFREYGPIFNAKEGATTSKGGGGLLFAGMVIAAAVVAGAVYLRYFGMPF